MKVKFPMPVLVRGIPPSGSRVRDIWMATDTAIDVPEFGRSDFEAVVTLRAEDDGYRHTEGILVREGRTYMEIGDPSGLMAFTPEGLSRSPEYIAEHPDMRPYALSRSVQEMQSRRLFLRTHDGNRSHVWPKITVGRDVGGGDPGMRAKRKFLISRNEHRAEDFADRLDVTRMEGVDDCIDDHARAAAGLVIIDGRLWMECGPPCIVVRTGDHNGNVPSIGLTTRPRWTEPSFRNAYFSLEHLDEARTYLALLCEIHGSHSRYDRLPEFDFRDCAETEFRADEYELDRFAEVAGSEVRAAMLRNPELLDILDEDELEAALTIYHASRARAYGQASDDLSHLALTVLSAWEKARYPAALAELPTTRRETLNVLKNRLSVFAEDADITVPLKTWSAPR